MALIFSIGSSRRSGVGRCGQIEPLFFVRWNLWAVQRLKWASEIRLWNRLCSESWQRERACFLKWATPPGQARSSHFAANSSVISTHSFATSIMDLAWVCRLNKTALCTEFHQFMIVRLRQFQVNYLSNGRLFIAVSDDWSFQRFNLQYWAFGNTAS